MKPIQPYTSTNEALLSLDNGGRFYNIFTLAEDGIISQSELGKVGGLFIEKQKLILFLELSISQLDTSSQGEILSKLDDNMKAGYQKYKAQELLPSEVKSKGIISSNAIITGIPQLVDFKSYFKGFILITVGKAFVPVPISDLYQVYEIRDETSSETFIIAHSNDSEKLPEQKMKVAGVLKELTSDKNEEIGSGKFLEVNYFLGLG